MLTSFRLKPAKKLLVVVMTVSNLATSSMSNYSERKEIIHSIGNFEKKKGLCSLLLVADAVDPMN